VIIDAWFVRRFKIREQKKRKIIRAAAWWIWLGIGVFLSKQIEPVPVKTSISAEYS